MSKGKVTGLGGFFIKAENPEDLKKWYTDNLGLPCDQYGHMFRWKHFDDPEKEGNTQFSVFDKKSDYLKPSTKQFMINFRVDDLDEMMKKLKANGCEIVGEIESFDYGRFGWVMDPDGNKIELWEPVDEGFAGTNEQE